MVEVPAGDVGDLEFAAGGWFQIADDVKAASVVEVAAGDGEVALGVFWFLLDGFDTDMSGVPLSPSKGRDAESFRVRDFFQKYMAAFCE
ncbi:hypothetical protein A3H90_00090 [Candidatus Peribacteria bacterium RIFCSPLOWO2_02_FULL_55_36]|nr:MAG: hypothetical protein A3D12_00960 [Candidatus Peribacteria bacterium RIFCSPHIGHO2_02_FULL_55_24]OGJ64931.1 MAG: hypothetical protein A3E47_00405 [Candidatus Peribacteria bacterium RIFCSPHIGHO2_12_FULL_54_10]OGJ69201.1 MAG: hypothetical protein A3H90_00090 [Candidatus Peribacteria bacterium RIFCSPLOWO2_02_FULL_55_36]